MNLHPDILKDLAMLYQAGEASTATRDLLEHQAASHPEFAEFLQPLGNAPAKIEIAMPDAQRRALKSIGTWNRLYSAFSGFAIALLLLPFSFALDTRSGEFSFFLWRESGIAFAAAAFRFRRLRKFD